VSLIPLQLGKKQMWQKYHQLEQGGHTEHSPLDTLSNQWYSKNSQSTLGLWIPLDLMHWQEAHSKYYSRTSAWSNMQEYIWKIISCKFVLCLKSCAMPQEINKTIWNENNHKRFQSKPQKNMKRAVFLYIIFIIIILLIIRVIKSKF
jgi:hypothetical protein